MLRDITLGQHYPVDSLVHRLDPRVKILLALAFMVLVFCVDSVGAYLAIFVFLILAVKLSKIPFKFGFVHCRYQYVFDGRRRGVAPWLFKGNQTGYISGGVYGCKDSVFGFGHVPSDLYDLADDADRRA